MEHLFSNFKVSSSAHALVSMSVKRKFDHVDSSSGILITKLLRRLESSVGASNKIFTINETADAWNTDERQEKMSLLFRLNKLRFRTEVPAPKYKVIP